jgi:hypothetical protein
MSNVDNFGLIDMPQNNYFTNLIVKRRKLTLITQKGMFST